MDSSASGNQDSNEVWGIQKCQVSVVIAGTDDRQWTCYCFEKGELGDNPHNYTEVGGCSFDPIAAAELDANNPIWRPREYFLKAFQIQIQEIEEEWRYLISKVESSIQQYVGALSSNHFGISLIVQYR
jgi:hypothetical protein